MKSVLIIDDDDSIRSMLIAVLEHENYNVLSCGNGEEGIRFFQNHSTTDLILLDVFMPGIGGFKCFQELRKIDPQVKVIVISGFEGEEVQQMLNDGALKFFKKPFMINEILECIKENIGVSLPLE